MPPFHLPPSDNCIPFEFFHPANASKDHIALHFFDKHRKDINRALLSAGGQAIKRQSANQNRTAAQRQIFKNVTAATNATIGHNFKPATDLGYNFRKNRRRCWRKIKVPPSMRGHHNAISTDLGGTFGINRRQYAFKDKPPLPAIPDFRNVIPAQGLFDFDSSACPSSSDTAT